MLMFLVMLITKITRYHITVRVHQVFYIFVIAMTCILHLNGIYSMPQNIVCVRIVCGGRRDFLAEK